MQKAENVFDIHSNAQVINRVQVNTKKTQGLIDWLTHISMASYFRDIGKQYSHRWDAAERGVSSGAILFAYRNFNEKWYKNEKLLLIPQK